MSQNTIRLWITRGLIEAHRQGRKWLIDPEEVQRMLTANPQLGMPRRPAQRATHAEGRAELNASNAVQPPKRRPEEYDLSDALGLS